MTDIKRIPLRELTVIGLACLSVVACSPRPGELGDNFFPHAKWDQIPPSPQNMVEVVTLRHDVSFASSEKGLGSSARGGLQDFILRNRVNVDDQIVVQAGAGQSSALEKSRLSAVKSEFAQHGLVASDAPAATDASAPATGEVAVLITRAIVIPPDCSTLQPAPQLRPEPTRGCHVNAAFGMMVANPLDLVQGRELGPGDGEQASGALRRYRTDSIKALNEEATN